MGKMTLHFDDAVLFFKKGKATHQFSFDGISIGIGLAASNDAYETSLSRSFGQSILEGPEMLFSRESRELVGLHTSIPEGIKFLESLEPLRSLPSVEGKLYWESGGFPNINFDHAQFAPDHYAFLRNGCVPVCRWTIAPDLHILVTEERQFGGLLIESPVSHFPGSPCSSQLPNLAIETYRLYLKYMWDDIEDDYLWDDDGDALLAIALIEKMRSVQGAAPLIELLKYCID